MAQWSGEDEELSPEEAHQFRSAMGTLLYLSADRWDIQHSVYLAQWMAKPSKLAKAGVRHVILYLAGTKSYAMLLPYHVTISLDAMDPVNHRRKSRSSQTEISDWAGDQSSASARRRHSVSSAMIFLNGRAVTSWSGSQRSIALSSCESEYIGCSWWRS